MRAGREAAATRRHLRELARLYGVQTRYRSTDGRQVVASADALVAVLRALGAPLDRPEDAAEAAERRGRELVRRVMEPVTVAWGGRLEGVDVHLPARDADGAVRLGIGAAGDGEPDRWTAADGVVIGPSHDGHVRRRITVDRNLATGYHRLFVEAAGRRGTSLVMAAPERFPAPAGRTWGAFVPLYAIPNAWGVGDLGDLEELSGWLRGRGGRVVATLPLLAAFLDDPFEPSPYSPASRLFWNELYLDPDRVPGSPAATGRPETGGVVDLREAMAGKRRALEPPAESFFATGGSASYERFVSERPEVRDYARFRAEVERRGAWWGAWPEPERSGSLPGDPEEDARGRYHLFAQWQLAEQLRGWSERSAPGEGLYLDLPVGASGASYDVWRERDSFAHGVAAGAPADSFFPNGQTWGFPPPHPEGIREAGYRYPIACLRNVLRYAGVLRVDHVLGLHRLFWIPAEVDPEDGVYVRYRAEEWYAAFSIEADRAGTVVVGEDLGTVPREVGRDMRRHGMLRTYVVQLEARADPPRLADPPRRAVASIGTHDLPLWAAFWEGDDVLEYRALGVLDEGQAAERAADRAALTDAIASALVARGLLAPGETSPEHLLAACLSFLGSSDAALVVASLEDLWLERRPQNVPGTSTERPNWRGRLALALDELADDPRVVGALQRLDHARTPA